MKTGRIFDPIEHNNPVSPIIIFGEHNMFVLALYPNGALTIFKIFCTGTVSHLVERGVDLGITGAE